MTSYGNNHDFNTVAFLRVDNQPPDYIPQSIITYNSSHNNAAQAWAYQQDVRTVDVIAKRSRINSTAYNEPFEFDVVDANGHHLSHLVLPAGKDYGFIRLVNPFRPPLALWDADTDFQINLQEDGTLFHYGSASIYTTTYPPNSELYIGDNSSLFIRGDVTLQAGTTVHIGKGSFIVVEPGGSINATGTTFQTWSGSTSSGDHWASITLNGNRSQFTQCSFYGGDKGLYVYNDNGVSVDRCTFEHNDVGLYAIAGSSSILGSTFSHNTNDGVLASGDAYVFMTAYQGGTFTPNLITDNPKGIYIYDNGHVSMEYTKLLSNDYGVFSTGNGSFFGGQYAICNNYDPGQGYNYISSNDTYNIYNTAYTSGGSPVTAYAEYNWWGVANPVTYEIYATVNVSNHLTYDPTGSGAQNNSCSQAAPTHLQAMNVGTTQETQYQNNSSDPNQNISDRLTSIYSQLSNQPDAQDNFRYLREAYGLIQMYDLADSSNFLNKLDDYIGQFQAGMLLESSKLSTDGKLESSQSLKSPAISKAMRRMGSTAVLLKMDHLLHLNRFGEVQDLANRFASFIQQKDDRAAFLASRAVAWNKQKQFAKALAAYKQIEAIQPDQDMVSHFVAPDFHIVEEMLADSMEAYNQAPEIISAAASVQTESSINEEGKLPNKFSIGDNYPNPFNPTTTIPLNLPKSAHVKVVVYNIAGQRVATLADREYQAGSYQLRFDAHELASGVYFIRARLGEKTFIRRMTLIK